MTMTRERVVPTGLSPRPVPGPASARWQQDALVSYGPAVLFLVLALATVATYRAEIGLDGMAYVSIAEHYLAGSASAINAYWSPLFSWLLVPLLAVGVPGVLAAKLLAVVVGCALVLAVQNAARVAGASRGASAVTALLVTPFLLAATWFGVFADVLVALWMLLFVTHLVREGPSSRPTGGTRQTALAGVFAGLAVLTKIYALPVVLVVLAVVTVARLLMRGDRPATLRTHLVALATLLAVTLPWFAVMSVDAGRPVLGSSARYNAAVVAPDSAGSPMQYRGLLVPPSADAFSFWEDPTSQPVQFGGFGDRQAVADKYLTNVRTNAPLYAGGLRANAPVLLLMALAGAVAATGAVQAGVTGVGTEARRRRRLVRERSRGAVGVACLTAAVWLGGLLPLFYEQRYLWAPVLVLAPLIAPGLDAAWRARRARPHGAWIAGGVAALLGLGLLVSPVQSLWSHRGVGLPTQAVADQLADRDLLGERMASDTFFQRSAYVCFRAGCQYVGRPEATGGEELRSELAQAGVTSYAVWAPADGPAPLPRVLFTDDLVTVYAVDAEPLPTTVPGGAS